MTTKRDQQVKEAARVIIDAVRETILEIVQLTGFCPLGPVYAALPPQITCSAFYAIVYAMEAKGEISIRGHVAYPPVYLG